VTISGATRVAGVIGDPVTHSLSPVLHNAAFEAAGLDWVYVAFPVPAGHGAGAVRAMADLGIAGLNVTMPHKEAAAAACDACSPLATRLGSVNTVVLRPDGSLFGDSTDGPGLLASLTDEGVDVDGRRVVLLGAGGAARAVAVALREAGAHVTVVARRADVAADVAAMAGCETAPIGDCTDLVGAADIVVNATPLGMRGEEPPFDPAVLTTAHVVVDLVYSPPATPLLGWASRAGAQAIGGIGMLVHQAALAFTAWTGVDAPLDAMRAAGEAGISGVSP